MIPESVKAPLRKLICKCGDNLLSHMDLDGICQRCSCREYHEVVEEKPRGENWFLVAKEILKP